MRHLPILTGPTGVGKTLYVNALLESLPIHVINLDSYQVFAFFRVGPGRTDGLYADRRHLYGYLSPHERLTVPSYLASTRAVVDELEMAGHVPLFEGGSRSLLTALRSELPLKIFGLRPPDRPGWREERLRRRIDGYFEKEALIREVEEGLRRGYGNTQVMCDPLVYMQTRDYLAGRCSLEEVKLQMLDGMLKMQDQQMAIFSQMDITWLDLDGLSPAELTTRMHSFLVEEGWLPQ